MRFQAGGYERVTRALFITELLIQKQTHSSSQASNEKTFQLYIFLPSTSLEQVKLFVHSGTEPLYLQYIDTPTFHT